MAGTRSSARLQSDSSSQPDSNKRKAEGSASSPSSKRGKTAGDQQKIDDMVQNGDQDKDHGDEPNGHESTNQGGNKQDDTITAGDSFKGENKHGESKEDPEKALKDSRGDKGLNAVDDTEKPDIDRKDIPHDDVHMHEHTKPIAEEQEDQKQDQKDDEKSEQKESQEATSAGNAIEEDKEREAAQPSNVLEKGIVYFFTRGRVGVEDIEGVTDIQRSHFVLRPIPDGAKIGDGTIDDFKNARLMALPKKVFPKSSQDKFMAFVEAAQQSIKDLKDGFFQGSEYTTQTTGVRQTPPVTPIGEGVYAITSTGNRGESHLAYMLTVPQEPGKVQEELGIRSQGSFLISLKNPEVKGPANASLPQKPDWPKEFIEEFGNRSWMPAAPKHLDYANAQILMIGESLEESHALDAAKKDEENDKKETPKEEIEKLEHEDEIRVKHLKGDDTIFADLGISKKDYPDVATTW